MLGALFMMSGLLIMRLVYGEDEYNKRWGTSESATTIQCLLSIAFIFWVLSILFLGAGIASDDTIFCIVYLIAFPGALMLWSCFVRHRASKNEIEKVGCALNVGDQDTKKEMELSPEDGAGKKLFFEAYESYLSSDPAQRQLFENLRGSAELRAAYLEECEQNKRDQDSGAHVSYQQSYMDFMAVLCHDFCDNPEKMSVTPLDGEFVEQDGEQAAEQVDSLVDQPLIQDSEQRVGKKRYCKKCGGLVDQKTKKCQGCGKQYFHIPKHWGVGILAIICVALVGLTVFQYMQIASIERELEEATTTISAKEKTITNQKKTISEQKSQIADLKNSANRYKKMWSESFDKAMFMDNHVVIIGNSNNKYHKYGCEDLDLSYFYAYNTENAQAKGYRACNKCN